MLTLIFPEITLYLYIYILIFLLELVYIILFRFSVYCIFCTHYILQNQAQLLSLLENL